MTRYVIHAPTLLHLVDTGVHVDPGHQLVAPELNPVGGAGTVVARRPGR